MATIEFGNVTCKLVGVTDTNVLYEIADRLSYHTGGFGDPLQLHVIFNPRTGITYTGLIPHMIQILKKHGISVNLVDRRTKPVSNGNFKLASHIVPRPYQQNVLDRATCRMVVQAATGAGKTLLIAGLIAKFNVKPVIVIAPKASLAVQLRTEISTFLNTKVGLMTGEGISVEDITVCTPQIANKHNIVEKANAIFFDEAHNIPANTICEVAKKARNAYYRVGMSATPWRDGDEDILIEAMLNVRNPKTNINASTLIRSGHLTPCTITFIKQESYCEWLGTYNKTYNKAIVNNENRNNKILELVKSSIATNKGSILVLFSQINHGMKLYNLIKNNIDNKKHEIIFNGQSHVVHTVEIIDGATSVEEREIILEGARQEKVTVLLGSTIADEGLSCSPLKVLILAGSGKASTRAFQRVGRVLRLWKGRNMAYVYDFEDSNNTFNKHFQYRKALYNTEPEWVKNMRYN